jgi:hypothetical protein
MWRESCARRVGGASIVAMVLACAALAALARPAVASASSGPACAEAVLDDWTRGTLDSRYSPDCYEAAIDALPEDLRAYTTAGDDIRRAEITASRAANASASAGDLSSRRLVSESAAGDPLRAFPTEVAVLAALIAVLGAGGAAAALARRRRAR